MISEMAAHAPQIVGGSTMSQHQLEKIFTPEMISEMAACMLRIVGGRAHRNISLEDTLRQHACAVMMLALG